MVQFAMNEVSKSFQVQAKNIFLISFLLSRYSFVKNSTKNISFLPAALQIRVIQAIYCTSGSSASSESPSSVPSQVTVYSSAILLQLAGQQDIERMKQSMYAHIHSNKFMGTLHIF